MTGNDLYFDAFSNVRAYNGSLKYWENEKRIASLPREKLTNVLLLWLGKVELSKDVDLEMVRHAAMICSSVQDVDNDIVVWMQSKISNTRCEIGVSFIKGYWVTRRKPSKSGIEFCKEIIGGLFDKTSLVYANALKALFLIVDPVNRVEINDDSREALRTELLAHLEYLNSHGMHKDVAESLEKLNDFSTRKYFAIFDDAKNAGSALVSELDLPEILNALVRWMEEWSRPGFENLEAQWYAGLYMGRVHSNGVDERVCDWLQRSTLTESRCKIACAFLCGYWNSADEVSNDCTSFLNAITSKFGEKSEMHKILLETLKQGLKGPEPFKN